MDKEMQAKVFTDFADEWALLTAGTPEKWNTMTIGWGALGTIWGKPACTVYVRTSRYTYEFMEDSDIFTVSFYPEECRKALSFCGSRSGREHDKAAETGLIPVPAGEGVTFRQAKRTLVCKKMYRQLMDGEQIPAEVTKRFYTNDAMHVMYIGEVIDVIEG